MEGTYSLRSDPKDRVSKDEAATLLQHPGGLVLPAFARFASYGEVFVAPERI